MFIPIPLHQIRPNPWQPRQTRDEKHIDQLAASIKDLAPSRPDSRGLLQIPAGRVVDAKGAPITEDKYRSLLFPTIIVQLAYGHSRFAAFEKLHQENPDDERFQKIPIEIVFLTDEEMAKSGWQENSTRKDLNAIEESKAIQKMMTDFQWTQERAATNLNLNRSTVANKLRLLKLPEDVQAKVQTGALSERQAIALLPLYDLPTETLSSIAVENPYYTQVHPETIVKEAAKLTSDQLRDRVKESVQRGTKSLGNTVFPLDIIIEGEPPLRPVSCRECDRTLANKAEKRCMDAACFHAKTAAWQQRELIAASATTGRAIAPPDLSGRAYDTFWSRESGIVQHALASNCPSLQLKYSAGTSSGISPDFPNTCYICVYGPTGKCACRATIESREKKEQQKRTAANKVRLSEEVLDPAVALVVKAIAEGNLKVWRAIALNDGTRNSQLRQRLEKAQDVETIAGVIAYELLTLGIWYTPAENIERAQLDIANNLKKLGLSLTESPAQPTAAD